MPSAEARSLDQKLNASPALMLRPLLGRKVGRMARVEERISDGRLLSLIRSWLKQDILKGMERRTPVGGCPQGTPKPGMSEALSTLKSVIAANPDHPGACHFYIHAVEKHYPERAVDCAERLANLMPGAGHLVHMPGHIYIRVGRYLDAAKANQHAIHADETYIRDQNPAMGMYTAGYYPHNYDFLAFATMMIGQSRASSEAADKVAALIHSDAVGDPGMDFLQHCKVRPLLVRIRFARWDEILESPASDTALAHNAAGRHDEAERALREGVAREDKLLYGEPPEWAVPARQDLGAALLAA